MANVSSNNLTTLYSGSGVSIRPTAGYGNSNVASFLNAGTDGANTITNIIASGNVTAQNFIGNFVGNLVVPGANTEVLYNNNGNAGASANLTFNSGTNVLDVNGNVDASYFLGNGSGLSSLTGANVTGQVPFAAVANSVAVANVSGIGNISVINLNGNGSEVLLGNGSWGAGGGGNVANANYANFAGTAFSVSGSNVSGAVNLANYATVANSVAGANVSGEVAFAAVANSVAGANVSGEVAFAAVANSVAGANVSGAVNLANYATVANSVSVSNVSGIGNIAVLNLDGNSGNILYGNGVFSAVVVPTSVANANYANFAGTAFSVAGANVSGEVAFAAVANSVAGANVSGAVAFATTANSVAGANVSGEVAFAAVANSVAVGNVSGIGNIATINLTGSTSNVLYGNGVFAPESQAGNANYANFAGTAFSVAGANVSGEVAFAAVANSVAVANVSGIGNIATINLDGNASNVLHGNGVFAPESDTGNANYAAYAGNVTTSAQPNITSLGNLISLVVSDSNVSNPITQVLPTGNVVGTALLPNNMIRIDNYNDQGNANGVQGLAFVKSRGNSSTPAAAANNDPMMRLNSYVYNGNTQAKAVMIETTAPVAAQANLQLANTAWTGGQFRVTTGNPNGDVANASANSTQNLLQFNQSGGLILIAGTNNNGTTVPSINVIDYGIAANGAGAARPMFFQRARGNRDGNTALANTDTLAQIGFQGYNGNAFFSTRFASIRANVNTTHGTIANGSSIPTDLQFITCSNTASFTTTLSGNGSASFPGAISTSGNITAGNISANTQVAVASNVYLTSTGVQLTQAAFQATNTDLLGGQTPFGFNIYGSSAYQEPMNYYRARGTGGSPSDCVNGDTIMDQRWQVRANGATRDLFRVSTVYQGNTGNDAYGLYAFDSVSDVANSTMRFTAGTLQMAGNITANNVSFTKYNETVVSGGGVSGTITPDAAAGTIYNYTLTGDITLNSLANVANGTSMTLVLTQDGTGGRTLTSSMKYSYGLKTLTTTPGATDIISVFYDGSTYYATLSKGYV